ncbi:hypothetical protein FACS189441_2230 [Betaproteobacteria bacterium]|nr:hypothetical protein FACS189441_2230 [Betaproteobacteria bacterium]
MARGIVIDWIRKDVNQLIFDKLVDNQHYTLITESGVEEKVRIEHQLSIVHQTAQSMPEKRLEVYRLRWIEGLSRKEIASQMGITVTTVDIHLKKACDYLKETIQANPKGNDY